MRHQLGRSLYPESLDFPQILTSEFGMPASNALAFHVMEREHNDQHHYHDTDQTPEGWQLLRRFDGPTGTFLWLSREDTNPARNWVLAVGRTYDEALRAGWLRARLYDSLDRTREA